MFCSHIGFRGARRLNEKRREAATAEGRTNRGALTDDYMPSPAHSPPSNSSTSNQSAGHTTELFLATAEAVLLDTRGSSLTSISPRSAGAHTADFHSYVTFIPDDILYYL